MPRNAAIRDLDPVDSILGGMTERRKLDRGVEAVRCRIVERISLHGGEVELAGPFAPGGFTPERDGLRNVRDVTDIVDEQQRTAADAQIAPIAEQRETGFG